jgi:hypothetical protein
MLKLQIQRYSPSGKSAPMVVAPVKLLVLSSTALHPAFKVRFPVLQKHPGSKELLVTTPTTAK